MKKILIVEDELIVRSIYRRKFEISGYQVETAEEGTAALNLMGTFKPDAVQVDIMLPGMDGVEVIKQIRSWPDFKSTPILVISSFYRPDLAKEAWRAGATKCVSKMDCTPNLALELVEQMLSGDNGASPFAKLGMSPIPNETIRVIPAENPWADATQILEKKDVAPLSGSSSAPAIAAPIPLTLPAESKPAAPKAPTLPTFAREGQTSEAPAIPAPTLDLGAPKKPTLPNFGRAESGNTLQSKKAESGNTRRFTKPDPEGTRMTTRPSFSRPEAQSLAKPESSAETPSAPVPISPSTDPIAAAAAAQKSESEGGTAFRAEIRHEFLKRAPQIQNDLRDRVSALLKSKSPTEQLSLLGDLDTSVASLASLAGITGYSRISHLSGAMDALIKDLQKRPAQMTNSVLRTVAHASDCLNMLFRDLERAPREVPNSMLILAVDDEPIARRTISVALGKANLRCITMEDPQAALGMLRENPFDLVFLDAEMPELNGFQLCTELRKLPSNKTTPVIFVTSLTKFEARAQSSLAGGSDLIAKPFLMMELAVKALTYLLRPQTIADKPAAK